MKLIAVVVMSLLLAFVSEAQEAPRKWAGRLEYEMATAALAEKDPARMIAGLLDWEAAYPNSEFAVERTESLIYAYQKTAARTFEKEQQQVALLYKIVSLGPKLNKRTPQQVNLIHKAAIVLLDQLTKPGVVAPADAKELAAKALAIVR